MMNSPRPGDTGSLEAMASAGITAAQIDLIIIATITPDMPFPSTVVPGSTKDRRLAGGRFDIEAACSGFIFGLEIAQQFIMSRTYDTVLVVGAEKLSSIVDWDRSEYLRAVWGWRGGGNSSEPSAGSWIAHCGNGIGWTEIRLIIHAWRREPLSRDGPSRYRHGCIYLRMEGKETFKNAVQAMQTAPKRRCTVVKSISRGSNASSRTRRIGGLSMRFVNGWAPGPSNYL